MFDENGRCGPIDGRNAKGQPDTDEDPVVAIRAVLAEYPEGREAWFLYRSNRLHEMIERWVAEHEVEPVEPAPWK